MSLKHIKNWLSEFRSMPESNFASYGKAIRYDKELIDELYHLFNDIIIQKPCQLLDPVCHQLFNCYKSEISDLHYFALDFIPTIIWSYFILLTKSLQSGGIAAFLLGVYNLGLSDASSGSNFTLPSIFQASIYHEPPFFSAAFLTESALKNRQIGNLVTFIDSPKKFDSITAHNRGAILSSVIQIYNSDIAVASFRSQKALCLLCSRLSRVGFGDAMEVVSPSSEKQFSIIHEVAIENSRILFDARLIIEVLSGIHFVKFNGLSKFAIQAINDAHFRACYDLNFEIIMMTNALLNALHVGDFPRNGLSNFDITTSRLQSHPTFIKDAITNASFKARKLPDDIDVQDSTGQQVQMDSSALSDSFEETHQVQEPEKSPYAKSSKATAKPIGKKDKTPRMSKSKENEPTVPVSNSSARKISTSVNVGSQECSISGEVMLKNLKQNAQEHIIPSDVNFKGKSNKMSHSNHDSKNQGLHVTHSVPNNKDTVNDVQFYNVSEVKNCSKNSNLQTEFTFL